MADPLATANGRDRPTLTIADLRVRATITVEEAAALLRVSRGVAYEAARRGELPVLSLGHRILVSAPALLKLLGVEHDSQIEAKTEPEPNAELLDGSTDGDEL